MAKQQAEHLAEYAGKELCAASIRSLAAEPSAFFRGEQLNTATQILNNPPLHSEHINRRQELRALADAFSIRLQHHSSELHSLHAPGTGVANLIFGVLEQLRLESLCTEQQYAELPGVRYNLQRRFIAWAGDVQNSELLESHAGILLFSLAVAVWARLNAEEIPTEIDGVIEATRAAIGSQAGPELQRLYRQKNSQAEFAQTASSIANKIDRMLKSQEQGIGQGAGLDNDAQELTELDDSLRNALRSSGLLPQDMASTETGVLPVAATFSIGQEIAAAENEYRVYTREFDVEVHAQSTLRKEKLQALREELDAQQRLAGINVARYSNELKQLLGSPNFGRWNDSQEYGFLNPAQLSSLVGNPSNHNVFRREGSYVNSDCHVSLLLDCSGSMKQHALTIALLCDCLNRAFGQAGIGCEILGFTTNSWNGGKPFKQWQASGKPANPGRLSEQRHTVYKAAEQSWRKGRHGIAALLRTDLYREGIDGEALDWAHRRLANVRQTRKVILVVSDGSPMETGTAKANGDFFLDQHLQQVAQRIEATDDTALCALGVGLDLSPYYRHTLSFDTQRKLSLAHLRDVAQLLQRAFLNERAFSN